MGRSASHGRAKWAPLRLSEVSSRASGSDLESSEREFGRGLMISVRLLMSMVKPNGLQVERVPC